jgi:predicted RNA methylase
MVKLRRVLLKAAQSVRSRGFVATARAALSFRARNLRDHRESYDARFGVDTAGNDPLWTLVDEPDKVVGCNPYHPADEEDLETVLRALDIDFSRYDFIDIGCGKGKALLIASRFGFRSLLGVELVKVLADLAKTNLQRQGIRNAAIVNVDARQFTFQSAAAVIFMFNPFGPDIMKAVVNNLIAANLPELFIIYCVPGHNRVFEESGALRRIYSFEGAQTKELTEVWTRLRDS